MKIQAVHKNVFVRWIKDPPFSKTIIAPERVNPDHSIVRRCEVISAGPRVTVVQDGDLVYIGKWAAQWVRYQGEICASVKEKDVLAVLYA